MESEHNRKDRRVKLPQKSFLIVEEDDFPVVNDEEKEQENEEENTPDGTPSSASTFSTPGKDSDLRSDQTNKQMPRNFFFHFHGFEFS